MKNVVIFNGGRGASSLIHALMKDGNYRIVSIVNAYDDGKSTGEIRNFFDMLGPSDLRKVQSLLINISNSDYQNIKDLYDFRYPISANRKEILKELTLFSEGKSEEICKIDFNSQSIKKELRAVIKTFLDYLSKFEKNKNLLFNFNDCSIMNCLFAGKQCDTNNLEETANFFRHLFNLQGMVLPNSNDNRILMALRENGEVLTTEAEIVEFRSNISINKIFLVPSFLSKNFFEGLTFNEKLDLLESKNKYVQISASSQSEIERADIIIYSSGTQHSSLYPTYLTEGLADSIANNTKAKKFFICNVGADYETPSYTAFDFFEKAYYYLNLPKKSNFTYFQLFNSVIVNKPRSSEESYVLPQIERFNEIPQIDVIFEDFESLSELGKHNGDLILSKIK